MSTRIRGSRKGQGLIGLLVVVIIIGYLWKKGTLSLPVSPAGGGGNAGTLNIPAAPQRPGEQQPQPGPNQQGVMQAGGLPDMAAKNMFKDTASAVRAAAENFKSNTFKPPKDLNELHRAGGIDLKKDPWGGYYYSQTNQHGGWLRCSGNPNIYEKVW